MLLERVHTAIGWALVLVCVGLIAFTFTHLDQFDGEPALKVCRTEATP